MNRAIPDLRGNSIQLELDASTFPAGVTDIIIKRSTSVIALWHDDIVPSVYSGVLVSTYTDTDLEDSTIYYYRVFYSVDGGVTYTSTQDHILVALSVKPYRELTHDPDLDKLQYAVLVNSAVPAAVYGISIYGDPAQYIALPGDEIPDIVDGIILQIQANNSPVTIIDNHTWFEVTIDLARSARLPLVVNAIGDVSISPATIMAPEWFRRFVSDGEYSSRTQRNFMDYVGELFGFYRNLVDVFKQLVDPDKILWQVASDFCDFFSVNPDKEDLALQRRLLEELVYLFQRSGTCKTLRRVAKVLTGWDSICQPVGGGGPYGMLGSVLHTYDGQSLIHEYVGDPTNIIAYNSPPLGGELIVQDLDNPAFWTAADTYSDLSDYVGTFIINAFGQLWLVTDVDDTIVGQDRLVLDGTEKNPFLHEIVDTTMTANVAGALADEWSLTFPAGTFEPGQLAGLYIMLDSPGTPLGRVIWNTDSQVYVYSTDAFGVVATAAFAGEYVDTGVFATRQPKTILRFYLGRHALLFDTRDYLSRDTVFDEFWYLMSRHTLDRPVTSVDTILWFDKYAQWAGKLTSSCGVSNDTITIPSLAPYRDVMIERGMWINPNRNQNLSYKIIGSTGLATLKVDISGKPPLNLVTDYDEWYYVMDAAGHRKDMVLRNTLKQFYSSFFVTAFVYHTGTAIETLAAGEIEMTWVPGQIWGCELEYGTVEKISILPGQVRAPDDSGFLVVAAPFTIDLTVLGAGGLDAGAEAPNTLYDVYLIATADLSTVSAVYTLSGTPPTTPAGFDAAKNFYLGSIRNGGAGDITPFTMSGKGSKREFEYMIDFFSLAGDNVLLLNGVAVVDTPIVTSGHIPDVANQVRIQCWFHHSGAVQAWCDLSRGATPDYIFEAAMGGPATPPAFVEELTAQIEFDAGGDLATNYLGYTWINAPSNGVTVWARGYTVTLGE